MATKRGAQSTSLSDAGDPMRRSGPAAQCPSRHGNVNADGFVQVDEVIVVLQHSLHGCPQ